MGPIEHDQQQAINNPQGASMPEAVPAGMIRVKQAIDGKGIRVWKPGQRHCNLSGRQWTKLRKATKRGLKRQAHEVELTRQREATAAKFTAENESFGNAMMDANVQIVAA